mmetsp:Transcript_28303/g.41089  ORF Transcript_28303/g.41089 Transcript_28303/m.41089 type:complete len:339 (+) Transcript_28303:122-1138(+)
MLYDVIIVASLVIMAAAPVVALIIKWWKLGGRVLLVRDEETGRIRGLQYIPCADLGALLGVMLTENVEPNAPKESAAPVTKDWVLALPEVKFNPSICAEMDTTSIDSSSFFSSSPVEGTDAKTTLQPPSNHPDMHTKVCCSVCLDDFVTGEKVRMLPCFHLYHLDCILPWLTEYKGICPLCQQQMLTSSQSAYDAPNQGSAVHSEVDELPDAFVIDIDDRRSTEVRRDGQHINIGSNHEEMESNELGFSHGNLNKSERSEVQNDPQENNDEESNNNGQHSFPIKEDRKEDSTWCDPSHENLDEDESNTSQLEMSMKEKTVDSKNHHLVAVTTRATRCF